MPAPSNPTFLICSLTSTTVEQMLADAQAAFTAGADKVEMRLDYLAQPPSEKDLGHLLNGKMRERSIVTYRPTRQGGRFDRAEDSRLAILTAASKLGAMIDIEEDVPTERRPAGESILSHHDFQCVPEDLDAIVARMDASTPAANKIAFTAAGPEDALRALDVLRRCRKPTISLAMGEAGIASRILCRKFGAFGTFAALNHGAESAPGQPSLAEFKTLYRWDSIGPATKVFGVIGCPIGHSMSPAIHNAAFAAAGLDAVYVPLLIQPGADNFNRFMDALPERPWLDWRGLSVTIPHKENAIAYVGHENCDELSRKIGAINTITISPDGSPRGDNTDYTAAIDALCAAMGIARKQLAGQRVAILGAGGAARSVVAALTHYRANVTIYNRTLSRAEELAAEFSCKALPIDQAPRLDASIVINCTPIGMHPKVDASPLERIPSCVKVIFDTIYNPIETQLLKQASAAGCACVSGLEMFINQAVAQFEIWTGNPAPRDVMRQVVQDRMKKFGQA